MDDKNRLNTDNKAQLKSEEEKKKSIVDPFSPTRTGLPVIIKDTSGNRIGNVWSPTKNGLGDAISNFESGSAAKIYYDSKSGQFANYPSSSMTYKDGKITLNVAKDVSDSDWYKNMVNGDDFKELASLYKLDPTGKTEIEVLEENENGEEEKVKKTINDLLQGYADLLEENSKKYQSNIDARTFISRSTNGALNLTDNDLVFMNNFSNFSKDNYGKSDVIFLTDSVSDFFKDYDTYNPESKSISADTFYKDFFNLNNELPDSAKDILEVFGDGELGDDSAALQNSGESDKDYAIDLIRLRVSQEMVDIVERLSFYKDDLSENEKASLATEYAKCYSLYKTMTKDTPFTDTWTGFNLGIQALNNGMAIGLKGSVDNAFHFLEQITYAVVDTGFRVANSVNTIFSWMGELLDNLATGGWEKMTQETRNMYEHFDEFYQQNQGDNTFLGDFQKQIKELGEILDAGENLELSIAGLDGKPIKYNMLDSAEDLALSYANTEAMTKIGEISGLILNQVLITNPIGSTVGGVTSVATSNIISYAIPGKKLSALLNMAKVFSLFATNASNAKTAAGFLKLVNLTSGISKNITKVGNAVGFVTNLLAQGVVDTFLENPSLTDALMFNQENKDIAEFQNEIRRNVAFNIFGEVIPFAGKGARKGIKFVASNTKWGAVTQAVLRKAINAVTLKGRKVYEGIAEFMTRNIDKKDRTGAISSVTEKLHTVKEWQAIRKEIIAVQEEISNTKIFRGDGPWSENAKAIEDLIDTRIDLETKLGLSKKIAIAEMKNSIIKNAGLNIETARLSEQTAELTILSKKMRQTNLPGSFSKETGDYINDLHNRQLLEAKEAALLSKGKLLSEEEQEAFGILKARIKKYEDSLPAEYADAYKNAAKEYLNTSYRFYDKLGSFLSTDAGANILSKEELARMRSGLNGARYMHQYAVNGYKGASTIEDLLNNPSRVVEQGKIRVEDIRFNKQMFSDKVTYFDPNFTREMVLSHYANIYNGVIRGEAVARAGRATSIQVDSTGKILKTEDDIAKARRGLYKELEKKFKQSLRETDGLGKATEGATEHSIKKFWSKAKRSAQREINDILGLNKKGLESFASTMNSEQIHQLSMVYSIPKYSARIRNSADLQTMYESLSDAQRKIVNESTNGEDLTVRRWNDAVTNNNLDVKLSRQYVKENSAILRSTTFKDIVAKAREESLTEEEALALKKSRLKVEEAEKELLTEDKGVGKAAKQLKGEFKKTVRRSITESVDATAEALIGVDNQYLSVLIKQFESVGVPEDLARKYIVYQWMYDNIEKNGLIQHIAFDYYGDYSKITGIKATKDSATGYSKNFREAAESVVESKLNKTIAQVQEAAGENANALIDMKSTVARTDAYLKDISDMYGRHEIVEAWDRKAGKFIYYKVDRSTYNLVTNYPTFQNNNIVSRALARLNAIARIGQITLRMASLVTQGFKDTLNAVILGGWDQLMLDNPDTYKKIAEYIGDDVVKAFKKEMTPSAWQDFLAKASFQQGVSLSEVNVREAIAKAEVENSLLGAKIKGAGTSSSYFSLRDLYEGAEGDTPIDTWAKNKSKWQRAYSKASSALRNISRKNDMLIDTISDRINFLHTVREEFLRKQVYRQNFMDALARGKSLEQARSYARYFMENATTNFSRGVAWGNNIVRSIPYFGAMLNGASSMIRLLEVDPLGVMMRFTTDLIVPTVGLTVLSLQNEDDAEIYKNIPEWEKERNLIWVVNGQVETVPIPEELAKFILPIRHAIEVIQGTNEHAWHELLLNDILNMPTIPLNAVMMLDDKKIYGDPTVLDRISSLALDLFNTLAPNAARTAYIATTGRDPYTGEEYGRTRLYEDQNGEYQYMSTSEYDFCQDLSNLFKGWGWDVNALMAEGILNSFFGTGSLDLVEGIRDFISSAQQGEANITNLLAPSMERAGNVLTGTARTDERQADIAWYSLLNELKTQKNELLSPSGKLAQYAKDIDMAKTSEEKAKKVELYNSEVRNWQNRVMEKVKWYTSEYGDYFDRYKFASTISYMTTELSINNIKDSTSYYNARAEAVKTMYDAGFNSPNDNSIFGYATMDQETGAVEIKYTEPLIITLSKNLLWYQDDSALAQIKEVMEYSGLKDKYSNEFLKKYNEAWDRNDYDAINKLAAEWDVEVIKTIKPIIDQYEITDILNNSSIIDYLDNYIKVPYNYEGMGAGQYYSSKTGLNKQKGYAKSYINKIYENLKEEEE